MVSNSMYKYAADPTESPFVKTIEGATNLIPGAYTAIGAAGGLTRALLNKQIQELKGSEKTNAIIRSILLGGLIGAGADAGFAGYRKLNEKPNIHKVTDGPFLKPKIVKDNNIIWRIIGG